MNYKKALSDKFGLTKTKTSPSTVAIALIGGIAIGTVVSLLFAPQSGEDTRNMISDKSKDLTDSLKDQILHLKGKLRDNAHQVADNAKEKMNGVKNTLA